MRLPHNKNVAGNNLTAKYTTLNQRNSCSHFDTPSPLTVDRR